MIIIYGAPTTGKTFALSQLRDACPSVCAVDTDDCIRNLLPRLWQKAGSISFAEDKQLRDLLVKQFLFSNYRGQLDCIFTNIWEWLPYLTEAFSLNGVDCTVFSFTRSLEDTATIFKRRSNLDLPPVITKSFEDSQLYARNQILETFSLFLVDLTPDIFISTSQLYPSVLELLENELKNGDRI